MLFFGGVVNKVYNNDNYEWKRYQIGMLIVMLYFNVYDLCINEIEKNIGKKAVDEVYWQIYILK